MDLCRELLVIRNTPRLHAAAAAGSELATTRFNRRMLVGGFRVTWDIELLVAAAVPLRTRSETNLYIYSSLPFLSATI
jgi:hypothetical protein